MIGSPVPGPGFGPTLGDRILSQMHDETQSAANDARKQEAFRRKTIWEGDFRPHVVREIHRRYRRRDVREGMRRHVSTMLNPARDFIEEISVVYKTPARRYLRSGVRRSEAWRRLMRESMVDVHAPDWLRSANAYGPVVVVPVSRRGGRHLTFETLLPHQYDVEIDPLDPTGNPLSVTWDLYWGLNTPERPGVVTQIVLDREAWRYFDKHGKPAPGPAGLSVVEHGALDESGEPMCPVAILRTDAPRDPDWYSSTRYAGLFDATISANLVWTRLEFVRKSQDQRLVHLFTSDRANIPHRQTLGNPESAIVGFDDEAVATQFGVDNYSTDPAHHLAHIEAIYSFQARSLGIPPSAVSFSFGGADPAISVRIGNERRNQLRNEQIPPCRAFDRQLAIASAAVMAADGNPLDLPDPSDMADLFVVEYPELNRIDDPRERREQDTWDMRHGLASQIDLMQRRRPELTRAEAKAAVLENVEEAAEIHRVYATHNTPQDQPIQSAAEANGAMGPIVRDQNNNNDDDQ